RLLRRCRTAARPGYAGVKAWRRRCVGGDCRRRQGVATRICDDIEGRLAAAGLALAAEQDGNTLVLSGMVENEEERTTALEIAWANWDGRRVEDYIEVVGVLSRAVGEYDLSEEEAGGFEGADSSADPEVAMEAGDYTSQAT